MGDGLKEKMISAFTWSSVDRVGQQFIQLIIGIVLARLLTPSDMGMIGVLMIFVSLSSVLVEGGFGQALIRKQQVTDADYSTIFFLNFFVSVLLYLVLFFAAPLISEFFSQPDLVLISRILFVSTIFYALYFIQLVMIIKRLEYKTYAFINVFSILFSGVIAIVMAYQGYGYWSLVGQQIAFQVIRCIIFPVFVRWRPLFVFKPAIIKEIWDFSVRLLGTNTLNVVFAQLYSVLIGRFYSLQQVGYYFQANKLSETVNGTMQQVIQNSTFPLFSKIQEDDERLLRIYRKLSQAISIIVFPLAAILIALAQPLLITLLSQKWQESVILFQLLIFANFFTPLYILNTSFLNSKGRSKQTLRLELIKKSLILVSVFVSFNFGIEALLMGLMVANFISYFISAVYIRNSVLPLTGGQLRDLLPPVILGCLIGLATWLINLVKMDPPVLLAIGLAVAAVFYAVAVRVFFTNHFIMFKDVILNQKPSDQSGQRDPGSDNLPSY